MVNRWLGWSVFSFSLWCWIWAFHVELAVLLIKIMVLGRKNWERSPPCCWKLNPVLMGSLKESSKNPLWSKLLRGSQTHLEHPKPSPPWEKRGQRGTEVAGPKCQADVQGIKVIDKFAKDNAKVVHLRNGGKGFDTSERLKQRNVKYLSDGRSGEMIVVLVFCARVRTNYKGRFSSGCQWC